MALLRLFSVVALLLALASAAPNAPAHAAPSAGPGTGAWQKRAPASVGLSALKLAAAAKGIGALAERYCFLVVKGGEMVHESYFANASDTTYETDSLAKTMVSQLVGIAVTKGLADLDTPIQQYGVYTQGEPDSTGNRCSLPLLLLPLLLLLQLLLSCCGCGCCSCG